MMNKQKINGVNFHYRVKYGVELEHSLLNIHILKEKMVGMKMPSVYTIPVLEVIYYYLKLVDIIIF